LKNKKKRILTKVPVYFGFFVNIFSFSDPISTIKGTEFEARSSQKNNLSSAIRINDLLDSFDGRFVCEILINAVVSFQPNCLDF
jgi:hypothetical protein